MKDHQTCSNEGRLLFQLSMNKNNSLLDSHNKQVNKDVTLPSDILVDVPIKLTYPNTMFILKVYTYHRNVE